MAAVPKWVVGALIPDFALTWLDDASQPYDFSDPTEWSFTATLEPAGGGTPLFAIADPSRFVADSAAPNLTMSLDDADWGQLAAGFYTARFVATRASDDKPLIQTATFQITPT